MANNSYPGITTREVQDTGPYPGIKTRSIPTLGEKAAAYGLGVLQSGVKAGHAINQLGTYALNKILGTHLQSPQESMFAMTPKLQELPEAKYGEMTGDVLTTTLPGAGVGRFAEEASLIPRMLAYGGAGAVTAEGGVIPRTEAALMGAAGGAGDYLLGILRHAPAYLSDAALGRLIKSAATKQKGLARKLYGNVFKGTEKEAVQMSPESYQNLQSLLDEYKGERPIKRALNTYNEDPSIENLHHLRSDLDKLKIKTKARVDLGSGDRTDAKRIDMLDDTINSLSDDVGSHLGRISEGKYNQYEQAAEHYRQNVVPFREFKALRDLLGEKGSVKGIRRAISGYEIPEATLRPATRIRKITGLYPGPLGGKPALKQFAWKAALPTIAYLLGRDVIPRYEGEL